MSIFGKAAGSPYMLTRDTVFEMDTFLNGYARMANAYAGHVHY